MDRTPREFEFEIGLSKVRVEYEGTKYDCMEHFNFYGEAISETGYRSHFFNVEEMKGKTIEEFAKELALYFNKANTGKKKENKVFAKNPKNQKTLLNFKKK
jgi:hypothetical protein